VRHARSADRAASDFERELTASGRADGERLASFIASNTQDPAQIPGWLVTSAATRARQTSAYIADAFGVAPERICVERSLYLANPETLIETLRETPADENCVALVAHNPGLTWLVNNLARSDEQLDNLPTMGCALFSCDAADWSELNQARLVSFFTPKLIGRKHNT